MRDWVVRVMLPPEQQHITMSVRKIHSDSDIPALQLPPGALSPRDKQYDHDPSTDPSAIEPIEHKLRLDLMAAGLPSTYDHLLNSYNHYQSSPEDDHPWVTRAQKKPLALRYAEGTIEDQWVSETQYFENYDSDFALESAPAYVEQQLRECRTKDDPEAAVKEERENRRRWYDLMPCKNLYTVFKQDSLGELIESNLHWPSQGESLHGRDDQNTSFVGVLVVPNGTDKATAASQYGVDAEYIHNESEFAYRGDTKIPTPSDYGIELPAPLLMGEYTNGSNYLFIPWSSGLVCQGPFKTDKPYRVMCKHEALAAFVLSRREDIFLPVDKGIDVPARARRFVDPKIATTHTSEQ